MPLGGGMREEMRIQFEDVAQNDLVTKCILRADEEHLPKGGKEHGIPHATRVAEMTREILDAVGSSLREMELGAIAGYLHDIGYMVGEDSHGEYGGAVVLRLLEKMDAAPDEIARIVTAVENYEGEGASPVSDITAALILADAADLRPERVRKTAIGAFNKGDKANYYATEAHLEVDTRDIKLTVKTEQNRCSVMDYFEFVMDRMLLCRQAAQKLGLEFSLIINGRKMF